MSINRVNITGNLTRDPELRATAGGTQVLSFGVAVNDRRRNAQTGEWEDYPNFVDCTMFGTREKGPRYLEMAEGYCSKLALNDKDEIIGYEFVNLGKMMDFIKKGDDANTAYKKAMGHYGRFDNAPKYIDPRQE